MQKLLKIMGWINLIVGILAAIIMFSTTHNDLDSGRLIYSYHPEFSIPILLLAFISWVFLLSFAKILELLERIAEQTKFLGATTDDVTEARQ